jgi:hypothetical protein
MNLAIRGIDGNIGPHNADTFLNDLHKGLKADYIMANPHSILKIGVVISFKMICAGNMTCLQKGMPTMLGYNI